MTPDFDHLRNINTFRQLVVYLRDELDWPIEGDDFEEVTFEYSAEDLGLDSATAAKIKEIKQLRPLNSKQPWGIFFVNFEPKRLPIVALRRILSTLVLKKRQSANKAHQAAWRLHDLLFISSYGESNHRDITFAHFAEEKESGDLPTLRVLGWDDEDTKLHIAHVEEVLRAKLRWPQDESQLEAWRAQWSSAFALRPREVITTSKMLAVRLAELARSIRKRANAVLRIETDKGPLRKLYSAFKEALIHDLSEDDFADMYAQTISYGLLTARVSRPSGLVADNLLDMVPVTNPFLKELLETFLTVGGRKAKIDFDELGVNEVVQLLRNADMPAVLRDFGDRNPQEDPVIHFYELFLKEYDAKKRVERGVFYTPRPVVSFIVRSVHEILQKEFGIEDGLADTTTWNEMLTRHQDLRPPKGVPLNEPFVQIVDPATGTGTFLVEVIEVIYTTMRHRWQKQGHMELEFPKLWNEYVPKNLLPRLYGFELMMAPYAIAHMKIGLKLFETGYRFGSDERARVYLTNSLEPPSDENKQREFEEWAPALAHEALAVNTIKKHQRFTVIIGNPPYSGEGMNKGDWIRGLIDTYMYVDGSHLGEKGKKNWLQDDYVKFIRYAQFELDRTKLGILGYINNHSFLDNPTFRGMRASLLDSFRRIHVLDLHGSSKKKERCPDDTPDENVFDIQQGVSVGFFWRTPKNESTQAVAHAHLWGLRGDASKSSPSGKYGWLAQHSYSSTDWVQLSPNSPFYLFVPQDADLRREYEDFWKLTNVMPHYGAGIITSRDHFVTDFEDAPLLKRLEVFRDSSVSDEWIRINLEVRDNSMWSMSEARKEFRKHPINEKLLVDLLYRPFDIRRIYFETNVVFNMRIQVMRHMLAGRNIGLLTARSNKSPTPDHFFCSKLIVETKCGESTTQSSFFPLFLYPEESKLGFKAGRRANLSPAFLAAANGLIGSETRTSKSREAEDIFHYAYGVFHSPGYRSRYSDFLKIDFPRLPLTASLDLFQTLGQLGADLVALHLLESPKLEKPITTYIGPPHPEIEKISYAQRTVWLDKEQAYGFRGVPEEVWEFQIGGYQVCEKWLKDRKGRKLSNADIEYYQKIVIALLETIRIMAEIDRVIEVHGGWPGAFVTGGRAARKGESA